MKAVLLGYHSLGCLGFEALLRHGFEVASVVTHGDDPREEIWWPSLASLASRRGVPVRFSEDLDEEALAEAVSAASPDYLFSIYYRHMLPTSILRLASLGALNLHGSLLPAYRGRAPVNWCLVQGESRTGVSLHHMVAKPDAGDLVDQEAVNISTLDTAFTLYQKLVAAADTLFDRTLPALRQGRVQGHPLDLAQGSYFGGRKPQDGRIDWSWSADRIYNLVRAVTHPYPGAFSHWNGLQLTIWWARPQTAKSSRRAASREVPGTVLEVDGEGIVVATGDGALRLVTVQQQGQPELPAASWASISTLRAGSRLSQEEQPS